MALRTAAAKGSDEREPFAPFPFAPKSAEADGSHSSDAAAPAKSCRQLRAHHPRAGTSASAATRAVYCCGLTKRPSATISSSSACCAGDGPSAEAIAGAAEEAAELPPPPIVPIVSRPATTLAWSCLFASMNASICRAVRSSQSLAMRLSSTFPTARAVMSTRGTSRWHKSSARSFNHSRSGRRSDRCRNIRSPLRSALTAALTSAAKRCSKSAAPAKYIRTGCEGRSRASSS